MNFDAKLMTPEGFEPTFALIITRLSYGVSAVPKSSHESLKRFLAY
jgi:hypothetical protein